MLMHYLANPYFLGYVLVVLLLFRFAEALKRQHKENVQRRQARDKRPSVWDVDV
ncbi:MAG: hypothetical protein JNL93_02365 [Pelomonas sp.]|nr:hypothetical protein [Roseateles sp.]